MLELCRLSHYHLRQIGQIYRYLTRDACSNAVRSAVLNRHDYSNALLGDLRKMDLIMLQRVQNPAARLVTKTKTQSINKSAQIFSTPRSKAHKYLA